MNTTISKESPEERQKRLESRLLSISCIVPVHNEQNGIADFVRSLEALLKTLSTRYEILLVDDGSADQTPQVIQSLIKTGTIKSIHLSRNFGKETALTAGLEHCQGQVAILIDSDFQHPLELIPEFLQHWAEGYDMVYGIRKNRDNESILKRSLTHCFYQIMRRLTHVNIVQNAGDFRLLDRKVMQSLNDCQERARFMKGLYAWVGFKSKGIPFHVPDRRADQSSWRFGSLTELAITGITSFSNIPLRIWSLIGFLISGFSFAYAVSICLRTLIFGVDLPGYASLMVAVMFFGGIQLLSIGILGEYVARIFNEVKQRPKYIVEEKLGFENDPIEPEDPK